MAVDLAWLIPGKTRVIAPGGVRGTVIKVSERLKKAPILVMLDIGRAKAYGPGQLLLVVEVGAAQGQALP